ncbi:MAG: alpha/beta hydrolase [Acidimicrobiales bacterium]|nr:alpha/beta hydrolase [Acidimicrobiales bacterium]
MTRVREINNGLAVYRGSLIKAPLQVVMIHGAVDRAAGMIRVAREIDQCEVVRYDRRGYGRSELSGIPCTFEEHVDDLEGIIGDSPTVLFGHSYGGSVALAAASRGNPAIRAAISYEAPRGWEPWWPPPPGPDIDPSDAAEHFVKRMIGDDRWGDLPANTHMKLRKLGTLMVHELQTQRIQQYRLEDVKIPLILGVGELSGPHAQRAAEVGAEEAPRAKVVRVLGAKHDAPMSHSREVADLIVDAIRLVSEPN